MIAKKNTSKHGTVYYWTNEYESDVTIVFCHGLTADHHLFDKQIKSLKDQNILK